MNRKKIFTSLLLILTSAASVNTFATVERKSYAGIACDATSNFSEVLKATNGNIENRQTSSVTVICPIVRDVHATGNRVKAVVNVRNMHATGNIACWLWSRNQDGAYVSQAYATTAGTGNTTLTLGYINGELTGDYFFRCNIPGRYNNSSSLIRNYYVLEEY
ncbi:MAG: hypothetical protein OEZ43_05715 [Gammaproteobacteria bacterium]|nr:hypothetical protein [Gammaproteobacteria bacterium]